MFIFYLQIFIEFCDGGALDSIIIELEKGLTEKQIAFVCRGMTQGLVHLHKQGIIHRDLKAGNVLLTCQVRKLYKLRVLWDIVPKNVRFLISQNLYLRDL